MAAQNDDDDHRNIDEDLLGTNNIMATLIQNTDLFIAEINAQQQEHKTKRRNYEVFLQLGLQTSATYKKIQEIRKELNNEIMRISSIVKLKSVIIQKEDEIQAMYKKLEDQEARYLSLKKRETQEEQIRNQKRPNTRSRLDGESSEVVTDDCGSMVDKEPEKIL